jgi:hypothetical protein
MRFCVNDAVSVNSCFLSCRSDVMAIVVPSNEVYKFCVISWDRDNIRPARVMNKHVAHLACRHNICRLADLRFTSRRTDAHIGYFLKGLICVITMCCSEKAIRSHFNAVLADGQQVQCDI